jgi:hypothetical protein
VSTVPQTPRPTRPDGPAGGIQRQRPIELPTSTCRELLAQHDIGRVAWTAADGPQLYPISYVWFDDQLVFRTSPYGVLSELLQPTTVVVEVDELDQSRRAGWSILVRGHAEGRAAPDDLVRLWSRDGAVPWIGGDRSIFIGVRPDQITGRLFGRGLSDRP